MYHKLREADGTITRSCLWLGLKKGMFVPNTDVRDSVPYRYCHFLPVDITPTQRKNLAPPHPCCNGQGDQTFKWCRAGGFHEIFCLLMREKGHIMVFLPRWSRILARVPGHPFPFYGVLGGGKQHGMDEPDGIRQ